MKLPGSLRGMGRVRVLSVIIGALGVFALLNAGAVTVVALAPERCTDCHSTRGEDALEVRESHAGSACLDCHGGTSAVDTALFAARQVYGMYLPVPTPGARVVARVDDAACVTCHDVAGAVSEIGALRIDHASCTAGDRCTDCHSRVAHGDSVSWPRSYDMFDCVSCHMSQAQSVQCDFCHTERSREERVRTGTFALTHSANWEKAHGMGDPLACGACHQADKCSSCHGAGVPHTQSFASNHSESAVLADAQCASCHLQSFCDDCHGLVMPHPEGFTAAHSDVVEVEGQLACERCHAPSDCSNCHIMHVHPGNARKTGSNR